LIRGESKTYKLKKTKNMLLFHTENLPHYGLERIFDFAKKAGFDGLEIGVNHNLDTQDPDYLKTLQARYDFPIRAFSLSERLEGQHENFQKVVRAFPGTTINVPPAATFDNNYKHWLEQVMPRLAKKYKLIACQRNVPEKTIFGFLPARRGSSLESLRSKGWVCLDLAALSQSNEAIIQSIGILGSRLKHVYLGNVSRGELYTLPQRGILPVESFLTKLATRDFSGDFTLRVQSFFLSEKEPELMLEKLKETREFFQKYYRSNSAS
jgi:sugar phosphate isomerase/epimerase